jgi:hypothetical protein
MFFEFIIALFAHKLLSRELVMLFFDSIRHEINESSRKRFDFKRFLFFLTLIIFYLKKTIFKFVIEIVNDVNDEWITNRNTLKTICDLLTKYYCIRICQTCFVFCFFSRRILHVDNHAMCSRFLHVSYNLYFLNNRRIAFVNVMSHNVFFAYDDNSIMFFYVFIFLTIETLS